jgi:hypothetical protein
MNGGEKIIREYSKKFNEFPSWEGCPKGGVGCSVHSVRSIRVKFVSSRYIRKLIFQTK